MDRREALALTATILGGTLIGSQVFLSGCARENEGQSALTAKDAALLDEIGETILPDTEQSPGAKAAGVGSFMVTIVNDCYDERETEIFVAGLSTLNEAASKTFGRGFAALTATQKTDLLKGFDAEARRGKGQGEPHFFTMMKELTIWGYFTSEAGVTETLRFNPVPGRYEGCIPYDGENAWA
ncbi:gluconate 2-dehydrogenase subunit 3 family protein [Neolewinella litorea]|uniref:Gluconate 2-dehydrogenase subunit 3 family protein n=1 Tax=Neolewinella litorea TaxID=2562452 RepID=A0A4S4NPD8_9BACT|nr:gluconate 2-dehydrogenase subunit 3 family protein [Neolewinella litorea]THH40248.1 gluconate 2-dehydrogenase subunit 3 family protein [Neolewinella litorea]